LDLDIEAFPVDMCTRTVFAKADIVLWRTAPDTFHRRILALLQRLRHGAAVGDRARLLPIALSAAQSGSIGHVGLFSSAMELIRPQGNAPAADFSRPTWAPAAKDAVGTAQGRSRLWFTIAQGIVTEVYHPRPDIPQLKDLGFIVADDQGFWIELRRLDSYSVAWADDAIPAITITHSHARFTLTLRICVDAERDVLLIDYSLDGDPEPAAVCACSTPHGRQRRRQSGLGRRLGRPARIMRRAGTVRHGARLPLIGREVRACCNVRSVSSARATAGRIFDRNGSMRWSYAQAGPGEVALTGKLTNAGTLALGLCTSREAAATLAIESLATGFDACWDTYCHGWQEWLDAVRWPRGFESALDRDEHLLLWRSAAVIKSHADHTFPGAFVASLSVPWGETNASRGGYHLVWARDLVETAGALVALGCLEEARRIVVYLIATQQADGHWLQNQWLGGKPFWQGIQLDETAFPVLLGECARGTRRVWARCASRTWHAARSASSRAKDRSPPRIGGRKTRGSTPSRSPS
jgi:glucoamylase